MLFNVLLVWFKVSCFCYISIGPFTKTQILQLIAQVNTLQQVIDGVDVGECQLRVLDVYVPGVAEFVRPGCWTTFLR